MADTADKTEAEDEGRQDMRCGLNYRTCTNTGKQRRGSLSLFAAASTRWTTASIGWMDV